MSKLRLLIMALCASLCGVGVYAQQPRVLTLEDIFALADENSKTIQAENAAVTEAQQEIREAENGRLPDIEFSASASFLGNGYLLDRDFSNGQSVKMPHFGNNFSLKATQLIYGGGAVSNSIAMAKLKHEMAAINREAARSRVRFMLTGFYLDLYKLQNLLTVYDRSIELANVVIEDTRARKSAGVVLQNDITRYELQLKNLELARKRTANAAEILNYDIVTMLGLPAETVISTDSTMLATTVPLHNIEYWQSLAQDESPAIKQTAMAVQMNKTAEQLARAERRPNIALVAANHLDGPITIEVPVINKNFNYWYVGVGLSWNISSLYKSNKSIRRSQYATQTSIRRHEEVSEQISLGIQADYTKYLEAYDEVATLEKNVQLAQENYTVVETRYRNEIALVTDMLDAANQLLDAELQLANSRINVIFNYYKLKHTSGNL